MAAVHLSLQQFSQQFLEICSELQSGKGPRFIACETQATGAQRDSSDSELFAIRLGQQITVKTGLTLRVFRPEDATLFEQTRAATLFTKYCFVLINFKKLPAPISTEEHCIITPEKNTHATCTITLPKTFFAEDFTALTRIFYPESGQEQLSLAPAIRALKDGIKLETACLLADYQQIVGRTAPLFQKEWLAKILPPEKKLFALSEALLRGDKKEILINWHQRRALYPPEFWTVYISELFWNSTYFCVVAQENGIDAAKALNLRLPFSFMQTGYKKFSLTRAARILERVAETDSLIKRGGNSTLIDWCIYQCHTS